MKSNPFHRWFLGLMIASSLNAEVPHPKVISIEAAMRTWQERREMTTGQFVQWPARSDGTVAANFPENCFYGDDLASPPLAAALVEALRADMIDNTAIFVRRGDFSNPDTLVRMATAIATVPPATRQNYVDIFKRLAGIISDYPAVFVAKERLVHGPDFTSGQASLQPFMLTGMSWPDALAAAEVAFSRSKHPLDEFELPGGDGTVSSNITLLPNGIDGGPGTVFLGSTFGRFSFDLSRYSGKATLYVRETRLALSLGGPPLPPPPPFAITTSEVAVAGGNWRSRIYGYDGLPPGTPQTGGIANATFTPHLVIAPVYQQTIDELTRDCVSCSSCDACQPGSAQFDLHSVDIHFALGSGSDGSAGELAIKAETPSPVLATPSGLLVRTRAGARIVLDSAGQPRQILAAATLVDISVVDAYGYDLRFYAAPSPIALDGEPIVPVGTPFQTYRVRNPDRSDLIFNRIQVSAEGDTTAEALYSHDAPTAGWNLERQQDGVSWQESRSSTIDPQAGVRIENHEIRGASGQVVTHERNTYRTFAWNQGPDALNPEELVESVVDPDGVAETTSYAYYADVPSDTASYGKLKRRFDPSGFWQDFEYDANGAPSRIRSPFLNAVGGASSGIREKQIVRSELEPQETIVETLVGTDGSRRETSRRYSAIRPNELLTVEAVRPGAGFDAADNLVTRTAFIAGGEFRGRPARENRPDGTATTYAYARDEMGGTTTTFEVGVFDSALDRIVDGLRTLTAVNAAGYTINLVRDDIASGLRLDSSVATETDALGRVIRTAFDDGTSELRSYTCCGPSSLTDRDGLQTEYIYAAGRKISEKSAGVETRDVFDAAGRRLSSARVGSDGSATMLEQVEYDGAGRAIAIVTPAGRTTLAYVREADGTLATTTMFADGATRVERTAIDGSLLSISGTSTVPMAFEYGADDLGAFSTTIKLGPGGERTEWVRDYSDLAGRPTLRVFADGAREVTTYNALGQIAKSVDADGVTTLFAYNLRGEREIVALDVNRNGVIDYAGADRIQRSHREVVADGGAVYKQLTESVWPDAGIDSERIVSIESVTANGRQSILNREGNISLTSSILQSGGIRVETTSHPDGTITLRRYTEGRLVENSVSHPAIGILARSTYEYDPHGRMLRSIDSQNGPTTFAYFPDDSLQAVMSPGPALQTTQFEYDSRGRLTRTTYPDGTSSSNTYFATGALQQVQGARVLAESYDYDPQGRIRNLISASSTTTWSYDSRRGWLVSKAAADGRGPSFSYSSAGRLVGRTWARGVRTSYSYDSAGDLVAVAYSDGTPAVALEYDRRGRLSATRDASGRCVWTYGPADQITRESYEETGLLSGLFLGRNFDSLSRFSSIETPGTSPVTYAYDPASRLREIARGALSLEYSYTGLDKVTGRIARSQGAVRIQSNTVFDQFDRIVSHSTSINGVPYGMFVRTYNSADQLQRSADIDGASWQFGYDPSGELVHAAKLLPDGTVFPGLEWDYAYDASGNRTSVARAVTSLIGGSREDYLSNTLDQIGRRTVPGSVDVAGTAASDAIVTVGVSTALRQGSGFFRSQTMDNAGRPVLAAIDVAAVRPAGSSGDDLVASARSTAFVAASPEMFAYDPDGNLLSDGRWDYTWDAENRLIKIETRDSVAIQLPALIRTRIEMAYDLQGRRIQKKVSTFDPGSSTWTLQSDRRFLHDGLSLVAEYAGGVTPLKPLAVYVWGLDNSDTRQDAGGAGGLAFADLPSAAGGMESCFFAYDSFANVASVISAATGDVSAEYEYDPFGLRLKRTGTVENPFQYSTQYRDEETGLLDFGLRFYSASQGRWISRDPLGESEGGNPYRFVSNNPTNRHDIRGLYDEAGHFWTSYVVAEAAGMTPDQAFQFAYFTQLPDELPQFDAVEAGIDSFGGLFGSTKKIFRNYLADHPIPDYDRKIQVLLHSLHGGGQDAIEQRRVCLSNLLHDDSLEPWAKGFVGHALGDSFAHTKLVGGSERSFSFPIGHAAESRSGRDPDLIAQDPAKYQRYVIALFAGIKGPNPDTQKLSFLISMAGRIPKDAKAENAFMLRWTSSHTNFGSARHANYDPSISAPIQDDPSLRVPTAAELDALFQKLSRSCCAN